MFIVGVLISIFAGLAVVNIQQQFNSNKRKAMIGEGRNLATAIAFARIDTGIYPKIPFLKLSHRQLEFESLVYTSGSNSKYLFNFLDAYGLGTGPLAPKLDASWPDGGFFAAATSRGGVAQGTGGSLQVRLREIDVTGNYRASWPADAYGNPWLLYLISINLTTAQPYFISQSLTGTPSPADKGDYFTAVVSYGPNRVPGGGPSYNPGTAAGPLNARIYTGDFRDNDYSTLLPAEYNIDPRPRAISKRFGTSDLAPNDAGDPTGILDPGSDDIVIEF